MDFLQLNTVRSCNVQIFRVTTVLTLCIGTPYLFTILVLKLEMVHSTTS